MPNNSPPVKCLYFMYPPGHQVFSELREISTVFLDKLDYLSCALADTHPSPEATKILQDIRNLATDKIIDLYDPLHDSSHIAMNYLCLMYNLWTGKEDPLHLSGVTTTQRIHDAVSFNMRLTEQAQKKMIDFQKKLESAINRISTIEMEDKNFKGTLNRHIRVDIFRTPSFVTDNIQCIAELFSAIDKSQELLRQHLGYLSEMERRTREEDSLAPGLPFKQEILVMREKWLAHYQAALYFNKYWFKVVDEVRGREYQEPGSRIRVRASSWDSAWKYYFDSHYHS